jgi:hypothetical protein
MPSTHRPRNPPGGSPNNKRRTNWGNRKTNPGKRKEPIGLPSGRHVLDKGLTDYGHAFRPVPGIGRGPAANRPAKSARRNRISTDPIPELDALQREAWERGDRVVDLAQLYRLANDPARVHNAEKARIGAMEGVNSELADSKARANLSALGIKLPDEAAAQPRQQPERKPAPKKSKRRV